jgi:hypothetical protein
MLFCKSEIYVVCNCWFGKFLTFIHNIFYCFLNMTHFAGVYSEALYIKGGTGPHVSSATHWNILSGSLGNSYAVDGCRRICVTTGWYGGKEEGFVFWRVTSRKAVFCWVSLELQGVLSSVGFMRMNYEFLTFDPREKKTPLTFGCLLLSSVCRQVKCVIVSQQICLMLSFYWMFSEKHRRKHFGCDSTQPLQFSDICLMVSANLC